MFEVGRVYNRRKEIHAPYGGQQQGGISTPSAKPFIFLFTGDEGEAFGYHDDWDENGVFRYTGEGQVGPMEFDGGNRAIRDHALNGKDLHLFQKTARSGLVRYVGQFSCPSWEHAQASDKNGEGRQVIVFHLVPVASAQESRAGGPDPGSPPSPLEELRRRAMAAAASAVEGPQGDSRRMYYRRSEEVRAYVLARAKGVCECCGTGAPFMRPDGGPYLEPHHTRRVSDGGPDHPRWVGGICPNCHRHIHFGVDGDDVNKRLQQRLGELEGEGPSSGDGN